MGEEKNIPRENSNKQIPNHKQKENENISESETKPETSNQQTTTDNMEVQKHPHHVMHQKKWSEYLLEFLMIFLAVFLGFIAENKREQRAEQKHAKEYAKSFLTDLISDTVEINQSASFDRLTNLMIDSFVQLINEPNLTTRGGEFYYFSYFAGSAYTTDWNKATINQLISSGSLRYFTNDQLVIKINEYNTLTNTISVVQNSIIERRDMAFAYGNRILQSKYKLPFTQFSLDDLLESKLPGSLDSLKKTNLPLENSDFDLINSCANAIMLTKSTRGFILRNLYPKAKNEAIEIIQLLKMEYHLQ